MNINTNVTKKATNMTFADSVRSKDARFYPKSCVFDLTNASWYAFHLMKPAAGSAPATSRTNGNAYQASPASIRLDSSRAITAKTNSPTKTDTMIAKLESSSCA